MRWSKCFIPTLRESPAGVETTAERLLVRAGYVRAVSTGVFYAYLPLGVRALARILGIAREELCAIGGQETTLEESAAKEIARGELRSAKQLPQIWYRIETPPLRTRQFAGLDVYWFGTVRAEVESALVRIVERSGVACRWSPDGAVVLSETGPDAAAVCAACGQTAAIGAARSIPASAPPDIEGDLAPEPFHTPGQKTIADLARFTGQPESMQMKSLVLVANGKPVLVMLRGDHQLSEAKFAARSGDPKFRQATPEELVRWLGAAAGSLGPVGVTSMPVWMDSALVGRRNMVCGANRDDYHLRHVTPGKDFEAEPADLREVAAGDGCLACGAPLGLSTAVELVRLGDGVARLSLERLLTAAVEAANDADGMILPPGIAPYDAVITVAASPEAAESLYRDLTGAALDVLLDDRDERAGVKFKDADLIGIPWRVTVGKKVAAGMVEVKDRRTKLQSDVPIDEVANFLKGQSGPG